MFVDEAEIKIVGGHGGAGRVSFGKKMKSGPDGGNGGRGGNVYLVCLGDLTLLNQFTSQTVFEAKSGDPGGRNRRSGKNAPDMEIKLPPGTSIVDKKSGELIFELQEEGQRILICEGGKGGRGNFEFRSPRRTTPEFAQPGLPGEKKLVTLVLKLIADFGLIGLPNAGKSSLLNEITRAQAKTAPYPFTTIYPNLGVYKGKVIADIPGLIEGASSGRGLGISFLKHIEKVGVLLHCITSVSANPIKDYDTVRSELAKYEKELLNKRELILITKSDLMDKKALNKMEKLLKKKGQTLPVSIHDWESLEKLKEIIASKA